MLRPALMLFTYIVCCSSLSGQRYVDRIVTISNDTINCKITLINDQNIFYVTQKRKTEKQLFISLNAVAGYVWDSKNQFNPEKTENTSIPYSSNANWRMSLWAVQQFNYPFLHSAIALSLAKKNHSVFLGPSYTRILNNFKHKDFERNAIGFNFGYRYMMNSEWRRVNFFLKMGFAIFEVKYTGRRTIEQFIVEYNVGLGLNYKLSDRLALFGGIGVGSIAYFLIMESHFIPHAHIGVQYNF